MTETPHTSRRTLLAASGSLATLGLAGCLGGDDDPDDGDDADDGDESNGDENSEDAPDDLAIGKFEIYDRDHEDDVLAYVHDDHWDHGPLTVTHGEYRSVGADVEDEDGNEVDLGGDVDLDVTIVSGDDVVDVESHGDHVYVHGEEDGFADIAFQLVEDDHVVYETPALEAEVGDHDHDDDHGHGEVDELKIFDRAGDEPEQVATFHDDHWDGELPNIHVDEHVSLGAEFYDDHGDEIHLGSDEEYEFGVRVADDAEEGIVAIDADEDFHGDHVHIHGESDGETDVVFMLWHDGHADWESDPIAIEVEDH